MAKSRYDSREYYNRESDGLKQRRLKEESRWRFNPKQDYSSDEEDESGIEDFDDEYEQR